MLFFLTNIVILHENLVLRRFTEYSRVYKAETMMLACSLWARFTKE